MNRILICEIRPPGAVLFRKRNFAIPVKNKAFSEKLEYNAINAGWQQKIFTL